MYEYLFIIVIMIFEYHSNIFSTRYTYFVLDIVSLAAFFYMNKNRPRQDAVWCREFGSVSYHWWYKHPAWAKLAAINNKTGCGTAEVWCRQFRSVSWHWYYHIRSGKVQLCSVITPTKPAQAISSIFSPKIQLGPNWQQSTTKMAVAWLWCSADSSELFRIIDTII